MDGTLKASFKHSRQGWLRKNQEVFWIEWHHRSSSDNANRSDYSSSSSFVSAAAAASAATAGAIIIGGSGNSRGRGERGYEVSPYFALRTETGARWRVTQPGGLLVAAGGRYRGLAKKGEGKEAEEQEEEEEEENREPSDEELFMIEVQQANMFTIRSKATGTYAQVDENALLRCAPAEMLQVCIKDEFLFRLAFKVNLLKEASFDLANTGLLLTSTNFCSGWLPGRRFVRNRASERWPGTFTKETQSQGDVPHPSAGVPKSVHHHYFEEPVGV